MHIQLSREISTKVTILFINFTVHWPITCCLRAGIVRRLATQDFTHDCVHTYTMKPKIWCIYTYRECVCAFTRMCMYHYEWIYDIHTCAHIQVVCITVSCTWWSSRHLWPHHVSVLALQVLTRLGRLSLHVLVATWFSSCSSQAVSVNKDSSVPASWISRSSSWCPPSSSSSPSSSSQHCNNTNNKLQTFINAVMLEAEIIREMILDERYRGHAFPGIDPNRPGRRQHTMWYANSYSIRETEKPHGLWCWNQVSQGSDQS